MSEETDQKMRNVIGKFDVESKINYMLGSEETEAEVEEQ
jgi:hypothetical protein